MKLLAELIGESPGIAALREQVGRLLRRQSEARRAPLILIQGETGTGKGLLARALHRASPRANGPFVGINCAAIPDTLLEAELFGFERGAFTDARHAKAGLFQTAHRGTLFLDEVGLVPLAIQAKLLSAIDERAVRRLGSTRSESVDAQIITATNEDLAAAMRAHRFREDLYHRLSVVTIWLPPLRERGRDVLLLAEHYLAAACADYHLPPKAFSSDAQDAMLRHSWPGNVRELSNVIERVALLSEEPTVDAAGLGLAEPAPTTRPAAPAVVPLGETIGAVVKERLLDALRSTRWNISRAATLLGMPRNTLRYQIEKHRLRPEDVTMQSAPHASDTDRVDAGAPEAPAVGLGERSAFLLGAAIGAFSSPAAPGSAAEPPVLRDNAPAVLPRWERRHLALLRAAILQAAPDFGADGGLGLQMLVDKVQSFGGRIEEMGQDSIVAAFGLEPVEDAPTRAGLAALAMQNATHHARQAEGDRVAVTIAVHTSQVMIGRVAGAVALDHSAKRDVCAVLDGLIDRAQPNTILVSHAAAPFLERRFDLVPLGAAEESKPRAYRLTGRYGSGVHRNMARFVGRRGDLDLLAGYLASARRGHGQVIGIVGEAGIGKSRLLFEFHQGLAGAQVWYIEGGCVSYGKTIPYLPVIDIVRQSCGIAETDTSDMIVEKIHGVLEEIGLSPEERAPYVLHMLGIRDSSRLLDVLSPEAIKARTFETLRQIAFSVSRVRPIVVVVEDLHWVDRTSEEYFASLVDSMTEAPILFISTYRPGYRPPWIDKSYATQMALRPLAPDESLSVVCSVLKHDDLPDALARVILAKAEGNPFFLEELARTFGEQGATSESPAVPDTIQDVLLARIDRLAEEPRRLLQTASVLGREVSPRLLRVMWDGSGPLDPHLNELTRLEFLYERTGAEETVFVFKHALIQEVAYESLLDPRRRALHAAAARAIETLYADRIEEVYDRLAHHYARTHDSPKAVEYLSRFADKAARAYAHVEAIAALHQALGHAERLPEDGRDRVVLDLVLRLPHSLNFRGRFKEALDLLLAHWDRLERVNDPALTGAFWFVRSRVTSVLGDHDEAWRSARAALEAATQSGDTATIGKAYFALAYEDFWSGRCLEGLGHAASAVTHLEEKQQRWWLAQSHWVAGIMYIFVGDFERALEALGRMQAIAEAFGDPRLLSSAAWTAGSCHAVMGDWEAGIAGCRRGLQISIDPADTAVSLGFLGAVYMEKGDFANAVPALEQSIQQCVQFGIRDSLGWFTTVLGEAYLLSDRIDDARERAMEGLRITSETRYRFGTAWAQRALGRIAAATGDLDQARTRFDEALRTQIAIHARHEIGRTHLDLATLAQREGRVDAVRAHLVEALRVFEELRVPRYVERARAMASDFGVLV